MAAGLGLAAAAVLGAAAVALLQALYVRRRTPVLPEADGPRLGVAGRGECLRLLVTGESPAAGVGVDRQRAGLAAGTAEALWQRHGIPCHWCVAARSGLMAAELPALLDQAPDRFHVVVLVLGVNDAKGGSTRAHWRTQLGRIREGLRRRHPGAIMLWCGVPDLARFPALPRPLATLLGWRARVLDRVLSEACAGEPDCTHLPLPIRGPGDFASDGFHPGAAGYRAWADELARVIADGYDKEEHGP